MGREIKEVLASSKRGRARAGSLARLGRHTKCASCQSGVCTEIPGILDTSAKARGREENKIQVFWDSVRSHMLQGDNPVPWHGSGESVSGLLE